jgi:hypothetical protein
MISAYSGVSLSDVAQRNFTLALENDISEGPFF